MQMSADTLIDISLANQPFDAVSETIVAYNPSMLSIDLALRSPLSGQNFFTPTHTHSHSHSLTPTSAQGVGCTGYCLFWRVGGSPFAVVFATLRSLLRSLSSLRSFVVVAFVVVVVVVVVVVTFVVVVVVVTSLSSLWLLSAVRSLLAVRALSQDCQSNEN